MKREVSLTRVNLSDYHVIDAHCHPFYETSKALPEHDITFLADFLGGFSNARFLISDGVLKKFDRAHGKEKQELDGKFKITSTFNELRLHAQNSVLYLRMIRELSQFLKCSTKPEEILESRNRKGAGYPRYIDEIFHDAKIDGLNVDDGYSEVGVIDPIPDVDLDAFKQYAPAKIWRTTRIEPLFQKSLDKSSSIDDMESYFVSSLECSIKKLGAVAFKSVIAYRSGPGIQKVEPSNAKKDFGQYKSMNATGVVEHAFKHLRD